MNLNYKYDLKTICDDTDFCDKTLLRCPMWVLWEYPGEDISTITSRTPQSHIVSFPVILGYYKSCISSTKPISPVHHWLWASAVSSNIYPQTCFVCFCKWLEMSFLNQQNKLQLVQWQTGKRDLRLGIWWSAFWNLATNLTTKSSQHHQEAEWHHSHVKDTATRSLPVWVAYSDKIDTRTHNLDIDHTYWQETD